MTNVLPFSSRPAEHINDGGFVRSCRRLFTEGDSIFGQDRRLIGAWMEMYHTAAWKPTDVHIGETWIKLQRGQLIINYREWAERWGLSLAGFYRACQRMAAEGRIRLEVKQVRNGRETACTVITICNYEEYQSANETIETGPKQVRNVLSNEVKEEGKEEGESLGRKGVDLFPDTQTPTHNSSPSGDGERLCYRFDEWWSAWDIPGTKCQKAGAKRRYTAVIRSKAATHDELVAGVQRYMAFCRAEHREVRYIKNPETWLNKGCWSDELTARNGNGREDEYNVAGSGMAWS